MSRQTKPRTVIVQGQPSWRLATPQVEAFVTETGGHIGPVTFTLGRRKISPFSVAPWATERDVQRDPGTPNIIKALRGDFFCMPFGGNATKFGREKHPVHGEVANERWKLASIARSDGAVELSATLRTRIRKGNVSKLIRLRDGQHAVYSRHVIRDMTGPMSVGHHAMLKFPDSPGSGVISTSPFAFAQVFPEPVERPENRGYSILKPGVTFDSLQSVPTITGEVTDLSRYPARRGFEDIVMLVADRSRPFAWTAVTFPKERFVWFALKDPRVLASTVLWISNGGRYYAPWNGRHVNVMGLEEVTANFHYGLNESAAPDNPIAQRGYPTRIDLDPERPTVVNYVMGVAPIAEGFDRVEQIEPAGRGVALRSVSGQVVEVPLDFAFLEERVSAP